MALTATATDNVGVAGVQFLVDNSQIGAGDTTSPYSVSWNTTTVANGTHTLTMLASDVNGNTALSAPVTVKVANAATSTTLFVADYSTGDFSQWPVVQNLVYNSRVQQRPILRRQNRE